MNIELIPKNLFSIIDLLSYHTKVQAFDVDRDPQFKYEKTILFIQKLM